jgi:unsaturated chondroitin disaccharide hydrolase
MKQMNVKKKELLGLLLLLSVMWGSCARSSAPLDTDKALDYCAHQVERALEALQPRDYTMMPRNILASDTQEGWNSREAIPQEWCSGYQTTDFVPVFVGNHVEGVTFKK